MRWPAFLTKRAAAVDSAVADLDAALAQRKAGRAHNRDRARRAAVTRLREQMARDPIIKGARA